MQRKKMSKNNQSTQNVKTQQGNIDSLELKLESLEKLYNHSSQRYAWLINCVLILISIAAVGIPLLNYFSILAQLRDYKTDTATELKRNEASQALLWGNYKVEVNNKFKSFEYLESSVKDLQNYNRNFADNYFSVVNATNALISGNTSVAARQIEAQNEMLIKLLEFVEAFAFQNIREDVRAELIKQGCAENELYDAIQSCKTIFRRRLNAGDIEMNFLETGSHVKQVVEDIVQTFIQNEQIVRQMEEQGY